MVTPLDRESSASFSLEVLALDQGVPQRSGSVLLHVDVTDANNNPPRFAQANHTAYVQEDKPVNHLMFNFDVSDDDEEKAGNAGPFTFEIRRGNENNAFRITPDGHLRTATRYNHLLKPFFPR